MMSPKATHSHSAWKSQKQARRKKSNATSIFNHVRSNAKWQHATQRETMEYCPNRAHRAVKKRAKAHTSARAKASRCVPEHTTPGTTKGVCVGCVASKSYNDRDRSQTSE
jgi:hypothetical protein